MTELEWRTCNSPIPMLELLRGRVSDRKLRLFAVACCHRIRLLITNKSCQRALAVAEQLADGESSSELLLSVFDLAHQEADVAFQLSAAEASALFAAVFAADPNAMSAALDASHDAAMALGEGSEEEALERAVQCELLRCIHGNPYRAVPEEDIWRTRTVVGLAQGIYEDRAHDQLPILADALQDAGCDCQEMLRHCYQGAHHVRGCWVVDWILGKE